MSLVDFFLDGLAWLFGSDSGQGEMPAEGYPVNESDPTYINAGEHYANMVLHLAANGGKPEGPEVGGNGHSHETFDQLAARTHEESIRHLRSVGVKVNEDKEPSLYERQLHPGQICTPVRGEDGKFYLTWTNPEE